MVSLSCMHFLLLLHTILADDEEVDAIILVLTGGSHSSISVRCFECRYTILNENEFIQTNAFAAQQHILLLL